MLILTTSKRIHQFTALIFFVLACISALIIYQHYDRYTAQPQALLDTLLQVIDQDKTLPKGVYDSQQLAEEAEQLTLLQIAADLQRAGVPDVDSAAQLLLPQASSFLQEDAGMHRWLENQLYRMSMPASAVNVQSPSLDRQIISSGDACLVIEKRKHNWQLVSLLGCQ